MTMGTSKVRRWINPKCRPLDLPPGVHVPLADMGDGRLMTVQDGAAMASEDDGKSWSQVGRLYDGPPPGVPSGGLLLRTRRGVLVLVYTDMSTFRWGWVDETREPIANVRGDVWTIRSLDGGRTWTDRQKILDGYCGALIDIIETSAGDVVIPIPILLYGPGRHETASYVSADQGKTWMRSNIIDLGGHGHHDGADEGTMAELGDGRVLLLLRTNWGRFWEALSEDGGRSWRTIRPTGIEASSSPGYLLRLASGRMCLAWNRPQAADGTPPVTRSGQYSQDEASWFRDELSVAFSEDDTRSWSEPQVVAIDRERPHPCYPRIFERSPGLIWITAGNMKLSLNEADFTA